MMAAVALFADHTYEEVESKKEYEQLWQEYYPFKTEWYFVVISESKPNAR